MQVSDALFSAMACDSLVHSEIFMTSRLPSASRRLADWLYKAQMDPSSIFPNFAEQLDIPLPRRSHPARDKHALIDTYWVVPALTILSWTLEKPVRTIVQEYVNTADPKDPTYFQFDMEDIEFMEWAQMLGIHLKVHGYFSPRHWLKGVNLSAEQVKILKNYEYRSDVGTEYETFMRANPEGATHYDIRKADLIYWLSIMNWVHLKKDLRSGEEIANRFAYHSILGPENALLFGFLYAYSEQEPILSRAKAKGSMLAFWGEYTTILQMLDVVD